MNRRHAHTFVDWCCRDRKTGRIVIVQFPNATLGVWIVATVMHRLVGRGEVLRWIGGGALLAWGIDELVRGANPFRRFLGALAVAFEVYAVMAAIRGT